MGQISQKTEHLLNILDRLHKKQTICIKEYANRYGLHIRSVQRYIEDLKTVFEDEIIKVQENCYRLVNPDMLLPSFHKTPMEFERLIDIYHMINPAIFDTLHTDDQQIVKKLSKQTQECFSFNQNPYELFCKYDLLVQIKKSIKFRRYASITYHSHETIVFEKVKPIKIVFSDGNWYLGVIDNTFELNNGFRWLRITFIKSYKLLQDTFQKDKDAVEFCDNFQSIFRGYKKPRYEVFIKADSDVARFFLSKKHLKTQDIIKRCDDGSLELKYLISNDMEIIPLIKKWLPHLKVLEPSELDEKIKKEITLYLSAQE